jgi:hypothetical protein
MFSRMYISRLRKRILRGGVVTKEKMMLKCGIITEKLGRD